MLSLVLQLESGALDHGMSGFSRGHMTIRGSHGAATSMDKQPDQSMMVFLSIVELLDGLRRFIAHGDERSFRFIGTDSSFQFTVERLGTGRLKLEHGHELIDEVETPELVQAVWKGIEHFVRQHQPSLSADDPVASDLQDAIESVKREFGV